MGLTLEEPLKTKICIIDYSDQEGEPTQIDPTFIFTA